MSALGFRKQWIQKQSYSGKISTFVICRKVIKLNWGGGGVCHQLQVTGQSPTPGYGRDAEHVLFQISDLLYPTKVRNRYQPDVRGYSLELRQTNLPPKTAIKITRTGAEERRF